MPRSSVPPAWSRIGFLTVAVAGLLVGLRRAEAPYADGDVLWGARAGRDFLRTGTVPRVDTYSWTVHGQSWFPNSWGWNVLLGVAHRVAGTVGIAVLGIATMTAVALVIGVAARRVGAGAVWTALLVEIVGGVFALFLYPRAQLVDYLMIFAITLLLTSALRGEGAPFWRVAGALLALQVLWINLHSAAVLGPVLVAAAGIGQGMTERATWTRTTRRVSVLTLGTGLACLATPYGTATLTHLKAVRDASAGLISEWRPVGFGSPEQVLGLGALLLGGLAAWFAVRERRYATVGVLLVLGIATASAIRFAPMVALYAVPELAAAAGRIRVRQFFLNRICALALAILAVGCLAGVRGFADPGSANASPRLVDALPDGCRLLNDLGIGGDVILRRTGIPVSIDSRNDLYGRRREISSLIQLGDPAAGLAFVRREKVTCVLAPSRAPLVVYLRARSDWRVAGQDSVRTLLLLQRDGK